MTSTLKIFKYRKSKCNVFACVYMSSRIKHCYYFAWSVIPFIHHFFLDHLKVCCRSVPDPGLEHSRTSHPLFLRPHLLLYFLTKTVLAKAHAVFPIVELWTLMLPQTLEPHASVPVRRDHCAGSLAGLQRVWLYRILPGGQVIQHGNEAELFHGIDFVMRHRSKEEEATDEFIFFSPFSPHRLFQDAIDLYSLSGGGLCSQTTKLWICGQIKNAAPHNRCPSFLASLLHCSRACFSEVAPPPQFSVST